MAGDPAINQPGRSTATRFNPRPPSMAGDPPCCLAACQSCATFQSAPAIDGGRSLSSDRADRRRHGFNPRPPSMAGDPGLTRTRQEPIFLFQSAPAIDGGRSNDDHEQCGRVWSSFQSAPAIDGGRSSFAETAPGRQARFNPRPPSMAGDPWLPVGTSDQPRFQSAPAIDGGRSGCGQRVGKLLAGFNPRPPSMAGDPCQPPCGLSGIGCFNPRPPSMAGDPARHKGRRVAFAVSIRARHRWRAIPC